ncbi:hypothetical protein N7493_006744 [Penicillium malachiteum]|uniref:Uncharacterized protein n=1 Tax=Penicillium malachiteum TaxID=1324776 RepID=A0AAD6HJY6_9EURO|nr:hypothetical protein N7493_006744 [Penicillium malachiteum]
MRRFSTKRISLVPPSDRKPPNSSLTTTDPPTIDASEVAAEYLSWYWTHEYPPENISPEQKEHWMKWKMEQLEIQNLQFAARIRSLQKRHRLDEMELGSKLEDVRQNIIGWVCSLPRRERLLEKWPAVNQYLVNLNAPSIDEEEFSDVVPLLLLEFITFAISSIMWKTLCAPILTGASPQQLDILERMRKALESLECKKSSPPDLR